MPVRKWIALFVCLSLAGGLVAETRLKDQLTTKKVLNLATAKAIMAAAEAEAVKNGWNVSIAIVDEAGRVMLFQRMDNTANSTIDIAIAKAQHSANFRRDTKFHHDLLAGGNHVILGIPGMTPLEGGLRILADDKVIGGIGVSGVQSPQDAQIAAAGIRILE